MSRYRCLSIKQPWAWAILNGKPVENRTWLTYYRGPFLIHASKTFDHHGFLWLLNNEWELFDVPLPHRDNFEMGGIVGKGKIIDCVD